MSLKKISFLAVLIVNIFVTTALACPAVTVGDLSITGRRVRPSTGPNTAAYLTITNASDQPDKLLKVDSEDATTVELHNNINDNGVTQMLPVKFIEIGKGVVSLKPGGLHIMLMGLKDSFQGKEKIPLVLHFEKAGPVTVNFSVKIPEPEKAAPAA